MLDYLRPPTGVKEWDGEMTHEEDIKRRSIRDAYLEPWEAFESKERLLKAFILSRPLSDVFQAVRWYFDWRFYEPETPWARNLYTIPLHYLRNMIEIHKELKDKYVL